MIKSFFKQSLLYTIPNLFTTGLAFIVLPIYTSVLGAVDYGFLELVIISGLVLNKVIGLEITQGLARYYTADKNLKSRTEYVSSAILFTVLSNSIYLVVSLLLIDYLAPLILGQGYQKDIYLLSVIYVSANGFWYFVQNQLRWEFKAREYALLNILVSVVIVSSSMVNLYVFNIGLMGVLIGYLFGTLSGVVFGFIFLRESISLSFSFVKLRTLLKYSVPLMFASLAVWTNGYIDRLMLNGFMSLREVGIYAVGFKVSSVVSVAMVGFQGALTPLIMEKMDEPNISSDLEQIFRIFVFIAMYTWLLFSVLAQEVFMLFFAPEFWEGASVVVYLVPAILFSSMYMFAPGMAIAKKTNIILVINIVSGLINALLNYFLIPLFGLEGASFATLLGNFGAFLLYMTFSQHFFHVPHKWLKVSAVLLLVTLLVWILSTLDKTILFRLALMHIGMIFVLIFGFIIGLFNKDEINKLYCGLISFFIRKTSLK